MEEISMPKDNSKTARARRQKDAFVRRAEYNERTIEDQIELVKSRPGSSVRELSALDKMDRDLDHALSVDPA
jgi:hypothetical protein